MRLGNSRGAAVRLYAAYHEKHPMRTTPAVLSLRSLAGSGPAGLGKSASTPNSRWGSSGHQQ